jgi:SAM-dependent methyltransferase
MTYEETGVDETIDRLLLEHSDLDAAGDGVLDDLDQFHIGGADAVDRLISTLALADGDRILDVGAGFGGPARQIARRTAHHVVGIDLTPAYVETARALTAKTGLSDLVQFQLGDIATFQPGRRFQAAITMHVQMNVHDKTAWFGHIADRLVPGSRLAVWEVCLPRPADLPWPMPWSLDGTDSFVVTPEALLAAIEGAGFTRVEWANESTWVREWIAKTFADGPPAGPALPMLLDDGYARVINFATALTNDTLEVWRGSFTKTAPDQR